MSRRKRRALWAIGTVIFLTFAFIFVVTAGGSRPDWNLHCLEGLTPSQSQSQVVQFSGIGASSFRKMKVSTKIFDFRGTFDEFDRRAKADFENAGGYLTGKLTAKPRSKYYSAATRGKKTTVSMQIMEGTNGQLRVIVTEFLEPSLMDKALAWCKDLFTGKPARVTSKP